MSRAGEQGKVGESYLGGTWMELTERQIRTIMGNIGDWGKKGKGKRRTG